MAALACFHCQKSFEQGCINVECVFSCSNVLVESAWQPTKNCGAYTQLTQRLRNAERVNGRVGIDLFEFPPAYHCCIA